MAGMTTPDRMSTDDRAWGIGCAELTVEVLAAIAIGVVGFVVARALGWNLSTTSVDLLGLLTLIVVFGLRYLLHKLRSRLRTRRSKRGGQGQ